MLCQTRHWNSPVAGRPATNASRIGISPMRHSRESGESLVAYALMLTSAACRGEPSTNHRKVKRRIIAALSAGWRLIRSLAGASSVSQRPTARTEASLADGMILQGPRTLSVEVHYCGDSYCAHQSKKAVETWLMPAEAHDDPNVSNPLAWRDPERLAGVGGMQLFALVSRDYGAPATFGIAYNGSPREAPNTSARDRKNLGLPWVNRRADLVAALERQSPR